MFKYADDTYVVIPACNALSRDAELVQHRWCTPDVQADVHLTSLVGVYGGFRQAADWCIRPSWSSI